MSDPIQLRFKPEQSVWFVYTGKVWSGFIYEVTWQREYAEYEVQFINAIGHQDFIDFVDTEKVKCDLFTTEADCKDFIKNKTK